MDEERKALIITHPFRRFNADEEEIVQYLENEDKYDSVFYIPRSIGRKPQDCNGLRSRIPPGLYQGFYEKGLEDNQHGWILDDQIEEILHEYDEIGLGGATAAACVWNTFKSIESHLERMNTNVEIYLEDEITYN